MSIWFKLLPFELQEITDFPEPPEEIKPGETVAGVVSDDLKKLYTLSRYLKKSADLLVVEIEYKKTSDEERGKIAELMSKARVLDMLFWTGVCDELHLWTHVGMIPAIRVGWQVVEFKQPDSPLFRLF